MNQEQVWRDFLSLPPIAQKEVLDFIAFLRTRYEPQGATENVELPPLRDEPFIGMWRDQAEMTDSSEWVRRNRKSEWG